MIVGAAGAAFPLTLLPFCAYGLTPSQVFDAVKDAVVVVKTLDAQARLKAQGSGVLISPGRVATNCHVAKGGTSYLAGRGQQLVHAMLYAEDWNRDICLLDAPGITGAPAQLGQAAILKVGDPVYAVGAPRGLEFSLSDGIVSQLRGGPPPVIQTTAAISSGSSGGGLFDEDGRLVGLTTLYVKGGQGLNFAMPAEWIGEVKPGREPVTSGRAHTEWLKGAIVLEDAQDWPGLLEWCHKWTNSAPRNGNAWYGLGIAHAKLTRYQDAIDAFRQAVRINSEDARAWFGLGVAYGKHARFHDALEAFRQAVRINPRNANAWYNLGVAYAKTGNRTSALDSVRELRRRDPALADKLFTLIVPR
jgi:hypothetical protein